MTLIIQADGVIEKPVNRPAIIDLSTGLLSEWSVNDLNLAENADVSSWIGSGEGSINLRSFNSKLDGWTYPKFKDNSVVFDGTAHLFNTNDKVYNQPNTIVMVAQCDAWSPTTTGRSRLFAGESGYVQNIYPQASRLRMLAGDTSFLDIGGYGPDWLIIVATFNGESSKAKVGYKGAIYSNIGVIETQALRKFGIGGSQTTGHSNSAFIGKIKHTAVYSRVFNENEELALIKSLKIKYNL